MCPARLLARRPTRTGRPGAQKRPWSIAGVTTWTSTTITSCDADTVFDRKYFSCLTYHFTTNPDRYRRFWQGPIMYYNNIWHVPAPLRLPHAIAGLNHLGRLSRTLFRNVFPQSTYSLSLRMAHDVDYWDPDIIPEDWHMFLKCYYSLGGVVEVDTMYTPIYMDGIRSRTYARTFVSYFEQARRHAWGCTDIPYAVQQVLDHPEIPLGARLTPALGAVREPLPVVDAMVPRHARPRRARPVCCTRHCGLSRYGSRTSRAGC